MVIADEVDGALGRVAGLVAAHGVHGQRLRQLAELLSTGWHSLDELIKVTALPRRTVEELLAAAEDDLERHDRQWRVAPKRASLYRDRFATAALPLDPLTDAVAAHPELLAQIAADTRAVPAALPALDHVPTTAETALRRALWLNASYDLAGGRLLCLGDHDLTSLAACAVNPQLAVTVIDVDERLLEFVDEQAGGRGYDIRCLHADLRFGLPPAAQGWADLVFTDPPYTPEGMALFLARGVECLRDTATGRLLVAYGYSERNPTLGLKVQQEVQRLGITFEAILPRFHRYHGAQAVGSASDLYVCRPTAKVRKPSQRTRIYTHGPQAVESGQGLTAELTRAVRQLAASPGLAQPEVVTADWTAPLNLGQQDVVAVDAVADPGPWLLRTLLAVNAGRVAVIVPNNHPDLRDEQGQRALVTLMAAKYRLRFHRSTPDSRHAVVVADAVDGHPVLRQVLAKAHGKLGNTWREALVRSSADTSLTKNQARDIVATAAPDADDLTLRLVDVPRHRLAALFASIAQSGR